MQLNIEGNGENLVLLYLGYGQDPQPFYYIKEHLPENTALAFIWDHKEPLIDLSKLCTFKKVRLIAWSMGVMLAPIFLGKLNLNYEKRYALNGTVEGIDDIYGIVPKIWNDTLRNMLTPKQAYQFYRLMCVDKNVYKEYSAHSMEHDPSSLQQELLWLKNVAEHKPHFSASFYDKAFIGKRDLIFPADAIKLSFARDSVETIVTNGAHYDPTLFIELAGKNFD